MVPRLLVWLLRASMRCRLIPCVQLQQVVAAESGIRRHVIERKAQNAIFRIQRNDEIYLAPGRDAHHKRTLGSTGELG